MLTSSKSKNDQPADVEFTVHHPIGECAERLKDMGRSYVRRFDTQVELVIRDSEHLSFRIVRQIKSPVNSESKAGDIQVYAFGTFTATLDQRSTIVLLRGRVMTRSIVFSSQFILGMAVGIVAAIISLMFILTFIRENMSTSFTLTAILSLIVVPSVLFRVFLSSRINEAIYGMIELLEDVRTTLR